MCERLVHFVNIRYTKTKQVIGEFQRGGGGVSMNNS